MGAWHVDHSSNLNTVLSRRCRAFARPHQLPQQLVEAAEQLSQEQLAQKLPRSQHVPSPRTVHQAVREAALQLLFVNQLPWAVAAGIDGSSCRVRWGQLLKVMGAAAQQLPPSFTIPINRPGRASPSCRLTASQTRPRCAATPAAPTA